MYFLYKLYHASMSVKRLNVTHARGTRLNHFIIEVFMLRNIQYELLTKRPEKIFNSHEYRVSLKYHRIRFFFTSVVNFLIHDFPSIEQNA